MKEGTEIGGRGGGLNEDMEDGMQQAEDAGMQEEDGPGGGAGARESRSSLDLAPSWAPLTAALRAYQQGDHEAAVTVRDSLGNREPLPAAYFFRTMEERDDDPLLELERGALEACRGHVLDIGAGAGAHALTLQARGVEVTALESDPGLVELLRERGVRKVLEGTPESLAGGARYDTLLLLMNGWGLAGTLSELPGFLDELAAILAPGGQVLADSTDLRPLLDPDGDEDWSSVEEEYPGDIGYRMEFRGMKGEPYTFLFVDPDTLERVAAEGGWTVEILARNDEEGYLSRLTRAE